MYDALKDLMADYIEEEKEKARKETEEKIRKEIEEKRRKLMLQDIEEKKEKIRKEIKEQVAEKYRKENVLSIRNIMKTLEYTAKQAMDLMMIPEEERPKYKTLL